MASPHDELARAALAEIAPASYVGAWTEDRVRDETPGVVDVVFASEQAGYRGWSWVVAVALVDGEVPTVLELGLIPGDDALLAPEWIPWSVRLAEWEAQQAAIAAEAAAAGELDGADDVDEDESDEDHDDSDEDDEDEDLDEDDSDDDESDDEDDLDEAGPRATHGGDIDGVDIDDLDDDPV